MTTLTRCALTPALSRRERERIVPLSLRERAGVRALSVRPT